MDFLEAHPWIVIALVTHGVVMGSVAYLILLERKVASWVQDRVGPNRVGPRGLMQPLADGIKFILKEDFRPAGVDRWLFSLAPAVMTLAVVISIAVLPLGGVRQVTRTIEVPSADTAAVMDYLPANAQLVGPIHFHGADDAYVVLATVTYRYPFQIASLNIGVLFILAVLSLAVYGVVLGGWASNNKYSFLGALRATAQMISYEVPLGLCVLCIVVMYGTLDLGQIVDKQAFMWHGIVPAWNCFTQPLTFLMFLVCIHAEANRAPFDLAECEQELVGGYHTEYSAMRFALFFLAEYAGMITTSAVCVALFFGGWHLPGLTGDVDPSSPAVTASMGMCLVRCGVYFVKVLAVIFVFMWVRWSLPRFRFDQLMGLAWRAMIPMSLGLLIMTAGVVYLMGDSDHRPLMRVGGEMGLALLAGNIAVLAVSMAVSRVMPPGLRVNRRIRVPGSRFNPEPI